MQFVTPLRPEKRYHAADEPNLAQGLKRIDVIRSEVPAITHVDYSARLQSVERAANPLYYDLIAEFEALTGVPMVVNTSFNVRGEPIVCTPEDALTCFFRTELDWLIIGSFAIEKQQQSSQLRNGGGHGPLAMD
jgi:carbamoyltransferase